MDYFYKNLALILCLLEACMQYQTRKCGLILIFVASPSSPHSQPPKYVFLDNGADTSRGERERESGRQEGRKEGRIFFITLKAFSVSLSL